MWPSDRIGKYGNLCGHKTLKKKKREDLKGN